MKNKSKIKKIIFLLMGLVLVACQTLKAQECSDCIEEDPCVIDPESCIGIINPPPIAIPTCDPLDPTCNPIVITPGGSGTGSGTGSGVNNVNCDTDIPGACSINAVTFVRNVNSSNATNATLVKNTNVNSAAVISNINLPENRAQGDPINTYSGEPNFSVVDFSYKKVGFPLEYKRYYNEDISSTLGELGRNWSSNYDISLVSSNFRNFTNTGPITVVCPNHVYAFQSQGDGIHFSSGPACFLRLERVGTEIPGPASNGILGSLSGGRYYPVVTGSTLADQAMAAVPSSQRYRLTDKDGTSYYFGQVSNDLLDVLRPIAIVDKNGNAVLFQYEVYISSISGYYSEGPKNQECLQQAFPFSFISICGPNSPVTFAVLFNETKTYGMRPKKIFSSVGNWEIDYQYPANAPIPGLADYGFNPPGVLIPYSYNYDNSGAGRSIGIVAVSGGVTLNSLAFNWESGGGGAPINQVLRSPSNINATYSYIDSNGFNYLSGLNDDNMPPGNRHPIFLRASVSPLLAAFGTSPRPVTQVLNSRGRVAFNYDFAQTGFSPPAINAIVTSPVGFWERDIYTNGTLVEKDFKMNGSQYNEQFSYDSNFNLTKFIDGNGHAMNMTYDEFGNVTSIQDPLGNKRTFTYDNFNQAIELKHIQDANLKDTYIDYDANGNPVSIREPLGKTTSISYFSFGLVESITTKINSSQSHITTFQYDASGNLSSISEPAPSGSTQFFYDSKSRLVKKIDPGSQATIYQWNDQDLVKEVDFSNGTNEILGYDGNNNLNLVQEPMNKVSYVYDADDNLIDINEPSQVHTHFDYDALNNRVDMINARGKKTSWSYNEQNLVSHTQDPVGKTKDFTYDGALQLKTGRDARGTVVTLNYFDNDLLKTMTFSDGTPPISYTYDANGNRKTMTDAEGTKTYIIDDLNRVTQIQNSVSGNFTVNYTYNLDGSRQTTTNSLVGTTGYTYFDNNLLQTITDSTGDTTKYSYNPLNQLSAIVYGNGVNGTFSYDSQSHLLQSLIHENSENEVISKFGYGFDTLGNATTIVSLEGQTKLHLDNSYRLDNVVYPGPKANVHFGYDPAGNRSYVAGGKNMNIFTSDDADELTNTSEETISYDGAGNMTLRVSSEGQTTYQWDALNRLVKVTTPLNSQGISYVYNGDNLRVEKINLKTGSAIRYLYDGNSVIAEVDGSSGNIIKTYNPGISVTDKNGTKLYFLGDGRGNVAGLSDAKQNLVRKYSYDAYGGADGILSDSNGYRFVGGVNVFSDDDAGLQYMWNRWYDSSLGRYISRDPAGIRGGLNLYSYAQNNPVNVFDPFGLCGETYVDANGNNSAVPVVEGVHVESDLGIIDSENISKEFLAAYTDSALDSSGELLEKLSQASFQSQRLRVLMKQLVGVSKYTNNAQARAMADGVASKLMLATNALTVAEIGKNALDAYVSNEPTFMKWSQFLGNSGRTLLATSFGQAGAGWGFQIGKFGGPYDEITIPAGTFIGGLGGYGTGYFLANQLLELGK